MVLQLAADATARGDNVAVASAGGSWAPKLEEAGGRFFPMPLARRRPWVAVVAAQALSRAVRATRPDVVHTHNVGVTLTTRLALATGRHRPPVVTTLHGLAPADYRNAARVLRVASDRVVCCAPSVSRRLLACGFPPARSETVLNGAHLDPADADRRRRVARDLGLDQIGGALVVGVGRLVEQKSWDTLIEASLHLEDVEFAVAGDGPLRAEHSRRAAQAGGRVHFVGLVDDVAAFLGLGTAGVSVSSWEGLPLSLLEMLSLGLPTVATAVDGVTDIVPDQAAVLVPPGEPRTVADAIRSIVSDADRAAALSRAARDAAPAWSPEAMLGAYRKVYERAVSR